MRADLKFLYSPGADPLEAFAPAGAFGTLVQAMIGPAGNDDYESFDFMLCTPEWFASNMHDDIQIGRHYMFVHEFDFARLEHFVEDYCTRCGDAPTWAALADKLGRLGKWEFEDYVPHAGQPL